VAESGSTCESQKEGGEMWVERGFTFGEDHVIVALSRKWRSFR
jgi:hypothetical protein